MKEVTITWRVQDIHDARESNEMQPWTDDQCEKFLDRIEQGLIDASIPAGWEEIYLEMEFHEQDHAWTDKQVEIAEDSWDEYGRNMFRKSIEDKYSDSDISGVIKHSLEDIDLDHLWGEISDALYRDLRPRAEMFTYSPERLVSRVIYNFDAIWSNEKITKKVVSFLRGNPANESEVSK